MATRSTIAIERNDGTVAQIYCHWDGYLSHNGEILLNSYKTPEKIEQLIALGDLCSLNPEIGEKHDFNEPNREWCTAFQRDRGETGCSARTYRNTLYFLKQGSFEEFNYIFRKGAWYLIEDTAFELLEAVFAEADE